MKLDVKGIAVNTMEKYFHQQLHQDDRPPDRESLSRQRNKQLQIIRDLRRRVASDRQVETTSRQKRPKTDQKKNKAGTKP